MSHRQNVEIRTGETVFIPKWGTPLTQNSKTSQKVSRVGGVQAPPACTVLLPSDCLSKNPWRTSSFLLMSALLGT